MADRRNVVRAVAATLAGAALGVAVVAFAMPYLRQVDPLGLSPVILISLLGGFVLGWYVRGKANAGRGSKVNSTLPTSD